MDPSKNQTMTGCGDDCLCEKGEMRNECCGKEGCSCGENCSDKANCCNGETCQCSQNSTEKNLCCGDEQCEKYVREKGECCGGVLCKGKK